MAFSEILGHRRLVGLLARAVSHDLLPQSLILAGPDGIGKRQIAVALAQAINCPTPVERDGQAEGVERDACGTCSSCRRIVRGVHPDVLIIEPGETGAIKIEAIRDAVERTNYRPFEGRRRVVIVDRADAMGVDAQNALLKTLEEPPSASGFILVTSRPDALLSTVRSRCQRVNVQPLTAADIAATLVSQKGYAEGQARAVAALAAGSLGRAFAMDSGELVEARDAAQLLLRQAAEGSDPERRLQAAKDLVAARASGNVPAENRERLSVCLQALASLLRDLGVLTTGAGTGSLANSDLAGPLQKLAGAYDWKRVLHAFTAVDRALAALERNNASPKIVADWLALQL